MSKAKHTPGPWNLNYPFIWAANDHGSHRMHVTVDTSAHGDSGGYTPREEIEANARLIAAAPELFDIVQRLVAGDVPYSVATFAEWDEMIRDAKAVLAKVEGVQTEAKP